MESNQVIIHVRFASNGTVVEIGERPAGVSEQEWFNLLSCGTTDCYESLSGGRGVFRVPLEQVVSLKVACPT